MPVVAAVPLVAGAARNVLGGVGRRIGGILARRSTAPEVAARTANFSPEQIQEFVRTGIYPDTGVQGSAKSRQLAAQQLQGGGMGGGGGRTSLGSLLGTAGRFALDNPGVIGAGLGMVAGAANAGRAGRLRSQAIRGLEEPQRENLDDLYDSANPYGRRGASRRTALRSLTSGY